MRILQFGDGWIRGLWFSADGQALIVAEGDQRHTFGLHWHNLHDGKTVHTLQIPYGEFALSPDLTTVVQFGLELRQSDYEAVLHIQPVGQPDAASTTVQLRSTLSCLAFTSDSQTLLIGCYRTLDYEHFSEIQRFDRRTARHLAPLPMISQVKALTMPRAGNLLITGELDNTVRVWQYPDQNLLAEWRHKTSIHQVVLSPDEKILAAVAGRSAALWDIKENRQRLRLKMHAGPVNDLSFAPDGETVATACQDGTVRLWNVRNGQLQHAFGWDIGHVGAVAYARDGLTMAAGGEHGRVVLWDVDA
jgi:WD40 repeat protein